MNNAELPAMPIGEQIDGLHLNPLCNGLTKREHFAAMAMQGYIAGVTGWSDGLDGGGASCTPEEAATEAVNYADALLKALENYSE